MSLLALVLACKKPAAETQPKKEAEAAAVKVAVVAVEELSVPRYLVLTGSLKADRETEVAADAAGKVLQTMVERGQPVKKGDALVRLDVQSAELSRAQARSQEHLARENAALAKLECERGEALYKGQAITKSEYDRRKSQCQSTELSVKLAETGAELAAKVVRDGIVRAPFAGVVGERFVNVGQYVRPDSRIASLYTIDPLRLELLIPEAQLGAVKKDLPVEFRVIAYPDDLFEGTVKYLSPALRARSRDLVAEAVVENDRGLLRPGMFAESRLRVGEQKLPVLPLTAVRRGEVAASIFTVASGRASERVVQLGDTVGKKIALLAGVKPGERVIDSPPPTLADGAKVQE